MSDKLIDGICGSLFEFFGNDIIIYTDRVPSNLLFPCFFVSIDNSEQIDRIGGRAILRCTVSIKFIPGDEMPEPNSEFERILKGLFHLAECIMVDGKKIPGFRFKGSTQNGGFIFSAVYDIFVSKESEQDQLMQKLKIFNEKEGRKIWHLAEEHF
ncbi:MAG: hypothetical protein LBR74_04315 [Eubacterium sp.]|nr:hypothetical protein [Eubacterium sp.]